MQKVSDWPFWVDLIDRSASPFRLYNASFNNVINPLACSGESAGDGREPVGDPQIPNGAFNERIPAIEALSGFLVNSGDEDEGDYDNGARIYETDQDTYDTYKDKVKEYYLKNSVE